MKRIIICEGKTDAILISYFLIGKFGWTYIRRQVLTLPVDRDNEVLNWYEHPEKPDQELAIWGSGSIEQIPIKLAHVTELTENERTPEDRFKRIVLFFDRDDRSGDECAALVKEWTENNDQLELIEDPELGQWSHAKIELRKSPAEPHELLILPIAVPPASKGNLEIFLMDAIRGESEHDEQLVDKAEEFIYGLPDEPYLSKKRYRPKARLGSILSVISPDWVFSRLDDRLTRITWEEIESVEAVYGNLSEL